jgi:hypothetical protein
MAVVDPAAFTAFDSTGAGGGQQAGFLVSQCPVVFTVQNHYKAHCSELLSECLAGADGRDQGAAGVRGDDFGGGAAHAQQILKNSHCGNCAQYMISGTDFSRLSARWLRGRNRRRRRGMVP